MATTDSSPWYRQPWPWLLMAGPAAVIVAGAITIWLAVVSDDGIVASDYYKRGLNINKDLARIERARALGLEAEIRLRAGEARLRLRAGGALPASLELNLRHPTRAGMDRLLSATRVGDDYAVQPIPLPAGHWQLNIEDPAGTWRLSGTIIVPDKDVLTVATIRP